MYVSSFTGPIQSLVNTSRLIQEGRTAFARYTELMETQPEIADAPGAAELPRAEGKLEFRDVGFRYQDGETVFRHLNLTVEAGEYVALVGASGVGKTTLCSLIPRFYQPEEGQVLLDGVPVPVGDPLLPAEEHRPGAAGRVPVHRHRGGEHRLRQARGQPGGGGGGREKGRRPRLYRKAAPGLRHGHRPPRGAALRGAASSGFPSPGCF